MGGPTSLGERHTRHSLVADIKIINWRAVYQKSSSAPQVTAASTASRSSSWRRRRRGWSGGGRILQLRRASRATGKRMKHFSNICKLIFKSNSHYIDVEISRCECVAVRGREVTRVVGDVDVAVIADLEGTAIIPMKLRITLQKETQKSTTCQKFMRRKRCFQSNMYE